VLRAEAKGQALHFDYDSLIGGSEVFKDRETGSRWQQALATAISGPLQGIHLALYPFLLTTWGEWNKQHPNTLVLKPEPGYAERMAAVNKVINQGVSGVGPAPAGAFSHDHRLRPRETVLGLEVGEEAKAFPLSVLRKVRVVNDKVGGTSVVIVHQPHPIHHSVRCSTEGEGSKIQTGGSRSEQALRSRNPFLVERIWSLSLGAAQGIAIEVAHPRTRILVRMVGVSPEDESL